MIDDIDAWWQRAVDAGAKVVTPVQVMNTAIATNWHVAAAHTKA